MSGLPQQAGATLWPLLRLAALLIGCALIASWAYTADAWAGVVLIAIVSHLDGQARGTRRTRP